MKLTLCLLLTSLTAAGQPALLDLVMPEAKAVIGVNVQRIQASRFGQFVFSQIPAQAPELRELIQATGLDPTRDLHEVVVGVAGEAGRNRVLLLVRGTLDGRRLLALARSSGAQSETYGGVEIVLKRDKEPMAVAFLKEGILVAGDPVGVCGVIAWQGQPARLAPGLRQKAAELSAGRDVWFVSTVPVAEAAAQVPSPQMKSVLQGETLKSIEQVSGGLRFGPSIEFSLNAVTRSEEDATNLANALRFLIGLARSRQPAAASFTEDLKVTGRTMNLSVSIPEAEVEKMILATRKAAPKAAEPAKPAETGITVYSSPSDMGVVKIPPPKN
ncbi:MAG: hypothetical protein AAB225_25685 [Acidobacteriota bacterium]